MVNGKRLSGFIYHEIGAMVVASCDPLSMAMSELTSELRACLRELDGASFDDVYLNVMAWQHSNTRKDEIMAKHYEVHATYDNGETWCCLMRYATFDAALAALRGLSGFGVYAIRGVS